MATKKTDLTEITPIKRFEHFLDSIAGGSNGEALDPISRIEEFLRRIAERESFQESEINRLSAIVPDPTAADTGKVLTASGEGSGSWEQASGGGNKIIITLDDSDAVTVTCNGTQMTDPNDIYALVGDAPVQAFYRVLSEGYWETCPVLEFQNLGTFILYRTPSTVYVDEERLPGLAYMQDYTVVFSDSRWVFIRQRSTYLCFKGGIF